MLAKYIYIYISTRSNQLNRATTIKKHTAEGTGKIKLNSDLNIFMNIENKVL